MKKMGRRIFGIICSFIIGAQTKIFAAEQTDIYGPPQDPNSGGKILDVNQPTVYGPPSPSGSGISSSISGGQLFSIIASILLFVIGLLVILNKNITKKVKIITATLFTIIIITLLCLAKFVF